MKPLSLTNIKYFCDAVRFKSLSASAKVNFVTLSAISQGIANLEKSIGASLLAHHPNTFKLTPEGEAIFKKGIELLRNVDELKSCLSDDIGALEFASIYSFGLSLVPRYLKKFTQQFPNAKINFHLGNHREIYELLRRGKIDFGIVGKEQNLSEYDRYDIYEGHFELYVGKHIKVTDQRKMKFILVDYEGNENLHLRESYLKKFGQELPTTLKATSWEAIANLVSQEVGVGYLPDYMIENQIHLMKKCDLDLKLKKHPYEISAIVPKGMRLRKSSEIFLSFF